jgi:hypothetical protein
MTEHNIEELQTWGVVYESTDSGVPSEVVMSLHANEEAARKMAEQLNEEDGNICKPFEGAGDVAFYRALPLGAEAVAAFLSSQQSRQTQVESVKDDLTNICDNCGAPKDSLYCCGQEY